MRHAVRIVHRFWKNSSLFSDGNRQMSQTFPADKEKFLPGIFV